MDKKTLAGQMYWKHAKSEEAAPENLMYILYKWIPFSLPETGNFPGKPQHAYGVCVVVVDNLSQTLKMKSQETTIQFHLSPDPPQCLRMNIRTHSSNTVSDHWLPKLPQRDRTNKLCAFRETHFR